MSVARIQVSVFRAVFGIVVLILSILFVSPQQAYAEQGFQFQSSPYLSAQNTRETAKSIAVNTAVSDMVGRSGSNWYVFTLNDPGKATFKFKCDYSDIGSSLSFYLYDANANQIFMNAHAVRSLTESTLGVDGLGAGKYYIEVTDPAGLVDTSVHNYQFVVEYSKVNDWEHEFNNDFTHATPIKPNQVRQGVLHKGYDSDYFKLELSKKGMVALDITTDENASNQCVTVSLWSSEQGLINKGDYYPNSRTPKTFVPIGLAKGTYYVLVYADRSELGNLGYEIKPVFYATELTEAESNDYPAWANSYKIGSKIVASLMYSYRYSNSRSTDEDWYKLTIPKKCKLDIKWSHGYVESIFTCTLMKANSDAVKKGRSIGYADGESFRTGTLAKGTYYLKVTTETGQAYDLGASYVSNSQVGELAYKLSVKFYVASPKVVKHVRKSNSATLKWGRVSGASSYQVRYSTKSNMKNAKVVTADYWQTSKTLKKLKSGCKYYAQMRTVRNMGGADAYSSWSKKVTL